VVKFLSSSQLPLAMGIFLNLRDGLVRALMLARGDSPMDVALERTGLGASAMPLAFAIYLAAVPAYGARAGLLFGFLLLLDAALLAVSLGRRDGDTTGCTRPAAARRCSCSRIWLAVSYSSGAWITVTLFAAACGAFYALAPMAGDLAGRPLTGAGAKAIYAAPILLFVFPVIARIEPAAADPFILFGAMFALLALIAWRALATPESGLYFIAAFSRSPPKPRGRRRSSRRIVCARRSCCMPRSARSTSACRSSAGVSDEGSSRPGRLARSWSRASSCCCSWRGDGAASSLWGLALLLRFSTRDCSSRARPAICRGWRRSARCSRGWCSASGGTRPRPLSDCCRRCSP